MNTLQEAQNLTLREKIVMLKEKGRSLNMSWATNHDWVVELIIDENSHVAHGLTLESALDALIVNYIK